MKKRLKTIAKTLKQEQDLAKKARAKKNNKLALYHQGIADGLQYALFILNLSDDVYKCFYE